ncbi:radical SAM protein [Candidatus Woesearchaeota archaeon]|nr:radical SAM protein [Candidatus Woesearchaeota archaeon]
MNILKDKELIPKLVTFKLAKKRLIQAPKPVTLTFSITSACQSLCKTCNIGLVYQKNPSMAKDDLTLEEIEKMFKNIGHVYFFNISGGEPFLRKEIVEIVQLACKHMNPRVIHTPTNALTPKLIEKKTGEILRWMKENGFENVPFTIKPSYDGVGKDHDEVRGVKGNFEKLMETYNLLKNLQKTYPNLKLGLGTVISNYNIDKVKEIVDFAYTLEPDTYINEVAENRTEMWNEKDNITPSAEKYRQAIEYFAEKTRNDMKKKKGISRAMYAFRLVYYDLVVDILKRKTQVIQCYGGITNVHINARGEIWPCCVLGYSKPMGNLRDYNFDFKKVWHSQQAKDVRKFVHEKKCACPLANQSYSNIMLHTPSLFRVLRHTFF